MPHKNSEDTIQLALSRLSERELRIIERLFGVHDGVKHSRKEVGQVFNISEERVKQVEDKVDRLLRE